MDWQLAAEVVRPGMRPASLFVWALFAVIASWVFWPYAPLVLSGALAVSLVRATRRYRSQMRISRLPPLSRDDWRRARSKLMKGKA